MVTKCCVYELKS